MASNGERPVAPGIPDDFDLDAARRAPSSTPAEERERCPHCGSYNISVKTQVHGGPNKREYDGDYFCDCCKNHFDDPVSPEEVGHAR